MKTWQKLSIVVAIQLLILASVVGFKQYTVWTGETVLLRVTPIDPRDPFRGDYVTLRYDISRVNGNEVAGYASGGRGYVELVEGNDGYWVAVALNDERRHTVDDSVLLKGDIVFRPYRKDVYGHAGVSDYEFEYGIEDIFIPEGTGNRIPWAREVAVKVKIDRFGNAVARGLYVDGEPFEPTR